MSFGFNPHYTEDTSLYDLSPHEFLAVAVTAVRNIGWTISHMSEAGLSASTDNSLFVAHQGISIRIFADHVTVQSRSTDTVIMDFGQNKENVGLLIAALLETPAMKTREEWAQMYNELEPDLSDPDYGDKSF
jgi:rhomboid protease GluP